MSNKATSYHYLARKPGSAYQQLFVKERWVSARALYGMLVREDEPRTVEEISADYNLPLEAVREAVAYCESNPPEIQEDWLAEEALEAATGMKEPGYATSGHRRRLSPNELARLNA